MKRSDDYPVGAVAFCVSGQVYETYRGAYMASMNLHENDFFRVISRARKVGAHQWRALERIGVAGDDAPKPKVYSARKEAT
ncbi:MAG: hypothetical protein WBG92_18115 [Thiohalocapsa sp.]